MILLIILQRVLYKPMLKMLQQRQERIRESMDYAERVKKRSAACTGGLREEDRRVAPRRTGDHRPSDAAGGAGPRGNPGQGARGSPQRSRPRPLEDVEYERKRVVAELRGQVAELAVLAAGRVLGKSLDDKTHRQVVDDFLNETGKLN